MGHTQLEAIEFDTRDLDAALNEMAIDTPLSIETQRSLASRVLITSSLAAAISSDEQYEQAVAELGDLPDDPDHLAFFANFSRGLLQDMRDEMGDEVAQIDAMTRRIDVLTMYV